MQFLKYKGLRAGFTAEKIMVIIGSDIIVTVNVFVHEFFLSLTGQKEMEKNKTGLTGIHSDIMVAWKNLGIFSG